VHRPRIGVTGPDRGGLAAWLMTALAVRRAGARPVRVTPASPCSADDLDAVIIGGGSDVDPLHYGEEPEDKSTDREISALDWLVGLLLYIPRILLARHSVQAYDPDRDQLEQHFIRHAMSNDKPLLGICRGAQLMNVTLGGSLYQVIDRFYAEGTANVRSVLPRKRITITPNSRLSMLLGTHTCRVNALHEQSIKTTGEAIIISAREPSGVIQGIEKTGAHFVIGVQWHPEYMPQSRQQQALFRELVRAASAARTTNRP